MSPSVASNLPGYNSTDTSETEVEQLLSNIWLTLVKTNIISIVMIMLLVMLVILVIILMVWAFLFMEDLEGGSKSKFYRSPSGVKRPLNSGFKNEYGTSATTNTNAAFDPSGDPGAANEGPMFTEVDARVVGASSFLPSTTTHDDDEEDDVSHTSAESNSKDDPK